MAKIKLPEKPCGMLLFWNPVNKSLSRLKLSSWPHERKLNLKLAIFHLKETFHFSVKTQRTLQAFSSGLHTANLSWQTRVGKFKLVCVNGIKTVGKHVSIWCQQFANVFCRLFLCRSHTPTWVCQHEFANLSLLCEGRFIPPNSKLEKNCEEIVCFTPAGS